MSWQAYEVLTFAPDFTDEPVIGMHNSGRKDQLIGMTPGFAEWSGTTSMAFGFTYRYDSPADHASLREFLNRVKGQWAAFYTPSWQPDLKLAEPASAGSEQLEVQEAGIAELMEARPDTDKRVIFTLQPNGNLETYFVVDATDDSPNEILTLDKPIPDDLTVGETMVGFAHLVRLADDQQDYTNTAPGRGYISLRMVTVRNKRTIETQEELDSEAIADLKAFEDVLAEDVDPVLLTFKEPTATGPNTYGAVQGLNYTKSWKAYFTPGPVVTLEDIVGGGTFPSALYDGTVESSHLTFCFDPVSLEVLAWQKDRATIRTKWYSSFVEQTLEWEGYSPVAYNSWVVDGQNTAGDAETAIFYLKPGYSAIFCRLFAEDFAVERQCLQTPTAPLYLHKADREDARIVIYGMDATHRAARWRSEGYLPPFNDITIATLTLDAGELIQRLINTPDQAGGTVQLDSGIYENNTKMTGPLEDMGGEGAVADQFDGEYVSQIIQSEPAGSEAEAGLVIEDGAFTLIQKLTSAESEANPAVTIDPGVYEIP